MISGSGQTLANLLDCRSRARFLPCVSLWWSLLARAGEELARARGVPTIIEPGDVSAPRLEALAAQAGASWIVLAGYLRRLGIPASLAHRVVNIHPHCCRVSAARECTACTCTERYSMPDAKSRDVRSTCDNEYDRGPIVAQAACPVLDDDTPESLAARVFELECRTYPVALEHLLAGRVRVEGRCARIVSE